MNGQRMSRRGRGASAIRLGASWLALLLAACTSTSSLDLSRREARVPVHVVQRGETLHKIAWQHRIDLRDLVGWNGLPNPDQLRIGQRLRLIPPRGFVAAAPAPPRAPAPAARAPSAPPPSASSRQPSPARATSPRPPVAAPRPSAPPATALAWSWPTDGRVVASFGSRTGVASGVGIGGRAGQPVRAAAAGRVVYAGGGLIGYGQLVIVKHDETFLSAYGYNSELLVTQGQEVARGATIALMGQGPERQPRLHFEIRRNGVPVDPLLFVAAPR